MTLVLSNRENFAKLESCLNTAVNDHLKEGCTGGSTAEFAAGLDVEALQPRLEIMKENVLARLRDLIKCAGHSWAAENADRAKLHSLQDLDLPPPAIPPTDNECKRLEAEVQALVERVAAQRARVLPKVIRHEEAKLRALRHATAAIEASEKSAPSRPLVAPTLQPAPQEMAHQLKELISKFPVLQDRLKEATAMANCLHLALEAKRKRPPPGELEKAVNNTKSPGVESQKSAMCDKDHEAKRMRQRLVQEARNAQ
mmetsp:Transcript_29073/g.55853  ORF Transcript_29073/g.55853 Transcript_29073/m.55853 type:complete len:256 (+) Transcript_29073:141-908(+)|eukprot:CAMPEP_0114242334 /NCGR_PEP_ID=MMETSP0058-20121206/10112_1 /TAXON_ID=36894 /ORGANISM="Pyramimonas parkeae, CCMP726" /LENGTH=255 /DNA_ID=CAMNT_0001354923 /DNA_START=106 /DNA_END=873 /DNA_ORIENTATION=+